MNSLFRNEHRIRNELWFGNERAFRNERSSGNEPRLQRGNEPEMNAGNEPSFKRRNEPIRRQKLMSHDITDEDYQTCCKIAEKLEDLGEDKILAQIIINLCFNYDEAKDYVVNYYSEIIEEEED